MAGKVCGETGADGGSVAQVCGMAGIAAEVHGVGKSAGMVAAKAGDVEAESAFCGGHVETSKNNVTDASYT